MTYDQLVKMVLELTKILLRVGETAAAAAIVYYGIRMVIARDDATAFGSAKKGLGLAIIGALIIFGAYTIVATIEAGVKGLN